MMRTGLIASLLLLAAPAMAQTPADKPQRICLRVLEIDRSRAERDEKSITFTMRNGDRYSAAFRGGRCSGIGFNGFAWDVPGDGRVCENMQTLKVLQEGTVCALGAITPLPRLAPRN